MSAYKNFRQLLPSEPIEFDRQEWEREHKRQIAESEKVLTEQARYYNDRNVGTKGLQGVARRQVLGAFVKRLRTETKAIDREPRLWASKILSDIANGEIISPLVEKFAKEALNITEKEIA